MNGIYVETRGRYGIFELSYARRSPDKDYNDHPAIYVFGNKVDETVKYSTEANRDRAWAMLEKAIAYGARLFRFPTDAELEKQEREREQ